jgi:N-acetyltransferase
MNFISFLARSTIDSQRWAYHVHGTTVGAMRPSHLSHVISLVYLYHGRVASCITSLTMRTYSSSRSSRVPLHSSSSDLSSQEHSRKRPLSERLSLHNIPQPLKRARTSTTTASSSTPTSKPKQKQKYKGKEDRPPKSLTQLHFALDSSILRTCPLCDLTYTKGAPEDETLHNSHCARIQRGMQWRRDEERSTPGGRLPEIVTGVKVRSNRL